MFKVWSDPTQAQELGGWALGFGDGPAVVLRCFRSGSEGGRVLETNGVNCRKQVSCDIISGMQLRLGRAVEEPVKSHDTVCHN